MKALQILEPGRAEWTDTNVPDPGDGEVLVKVLGVTTCPHWDIHLMDGDPMFPGGGIEYPYTPGQPGHEAMGEVVAAGPGTAGPAVGARVAAWRDPGHRRPGCYAQFVCMAVENVLQVPGSLEPAQIASLELAMCLQVSFDQLGQLDAVRGQRVGIGGLGPAGLIAVQMAKHYGAREVVGIDPLPQRRALARELGADVALAPGDDRFERGAHSDDALDAALDCTGLKVSIEALMACTRRVVAIFGVLREDVVYGPGYWGRLSLLGYGRHNRQAAERALRLITDGTLRLSPLVTQVLPFTRYAEGVELLRNKQAVKIMFDPWAA